MKSAEFKAIEFYKEKVDLCSTNKDEWWKLLYVRMTVGWSMHYAAAAYNWDPLPYGAQVEVNWSTMKEYLERVEKNYYTVKTDVLRTGRGNLYQIIFFYNDLSAVKGLKKGQKIKAHGRLLKIVDRGLWLYIWIGVSQ